MKITILNTEIEVDYTVYRVYRLTLESLLEKKHNCKADNSLNHFTMVAKRLIRFSTAKKLLNEKEILFKCVKDIFNRTNVLDFDYCVKNMSSFLESKFYQDLNVKLN